jgi:hypothetical protein
MPILIAIDLSGPDESRQSAILPTLPWNPPLRERCGMTYARGFGGPPAGSTAVGLARKAMRQMGFRAGDSLR